MTITAATPSSLDIQYLRLLNNNIRNNKISILKTIVGSATFSFPYCAPPYDWLPVCAKHTAATTFAISSTSPPSETLANIWHDSAYCLTCVRRTPYGMCVDKNALVSDRTIEPPPTQNGFPPQQKHHWLLLTLRTKCFWQFAQTTALRSHTRIVNKFSQRHPNVKQQVSIAVHTEKCFASTTTTTRRRDCVQNWIRRNWQFELLFFYCFYLEIHVIDDNVNIPNDWSTAAHRTDLCKCCDY